MVTGDAEGIVRIWDLAAGAPMRGHDYPITSVISTQATIGDIRVVSSDSRGTIWQWDPATGKPTKKIDLRCSLDSFLAALSGPEGRPLLAHCSGYAGGDDREAFVHDPATGAQYSGPFSAAGDFITRLAAVPGPEGHDLLECGGRAGAVQEWDPVSGAALGEPLTGHSSLSALAGLRVAGAPVLASAGSRQYGELDDALCLWDVATGSCLISLHLDMTILSLAAWGNRLAVHCDNGILVLEFDGLPGLDRG